MNHPGPPFQPGPPQGPPGGPPPGPPGGRPPGSGGETVGFAVLGAVLFVLVNAVLGFFVFAGSGGGSEFRFAAGMYTGITMLAVFGGGAALIRRGTPKAKGAGLGLMIGWALVTVCTVGFCTGVNPTLYELMGPSATAGAIR